MNVRTLFALASMVAMASVAAIAYLVLPERIWTPTTIGALVLFGVAIGFALYSPFSLPSEGQGGDAAPMASLGMMSVIVSGLLAWSAMTLIVALTGRETITWVMMVVTVAGFLIANLLLHATTTIVDQVAAKTTGPSSRALWRVQIEALQSASTNVDAKEALAQLTEKIQFSASDIDDLRATENDQISVAINKLQNLTASTTSNKEQVQSLISSIGTLVDQREAQLKMLRTKS